MKKEYSTLEIEILRFGIFDVTNFLSGGDDGEYDAETAEANGE